MERSHIVKYPGFRINQDRDGRRQWCILQSGAAKGEAGGVQRSPLKAAEVYVGAGELSGAKGAVPERGPPSAGVELQKESRYRPGVETVEPTPHFLRARLAQEGANQTTGNPEVWELRNFDRHGRRMVFWE